MNLLNYQKMKQKLNEKELKYCDQFGKKSELSKWDYKKQGINVQ